MANKTRWWALAALTVLSFAAGWDATVLNVALPTLSAALGASEGELQWFVSGYLLTLAALLLPGGLLADRYGRRLVLVGSLALFGLGSIVCAYATSPAVFIAARLLMGAGAGAMTPPILSVITVLFDVDERPKAVGIWYAASFISLPVGPVLGGWILAHAWWGWVFLINVPLSLVALLAIVAWVPESRSARPPALDVAGIGASSAGLAALVYGLIEAGEAGWTDRTALAGIVLGLILLGAFALWERYLGAQPGGQPIVDLGLFRERSFGAGTVLAGTGLFALYGALFVAPQYFQAILGSDAMDSGLRLLPLVIGLAVGAIPADRAAARVGSKLTVAAGLAIMTLGLGLGATTGLASTGLFAAVWTAIVGFGSGAVGATASSAALSVLSGEQAGVGSALMQMVQKTAAPLAAAILGSVLNSTYQSHVSVGSLPADMAPSVKASVFGGLAVARQMGSAELLGSVRSAFVAGVDNVALVSAVTAGVAIMLSLAFLPAHNTNSQAAERRVAGAERVME